MNGVRLNGDRQPPDTRNASARPVFVCLPSSDRAFADIVREVAASIVELTLRALEEALRLVYPDARVRLRELSGEQFTTWYVYRDRAFPRRIDEAPATG